MINLWFRVAAVLMFAGVVLGAFGAHGLKTRLSPESLAIYHTAVLYHFLHALGLFVVAWAAAHSPASGRVRLAGFAFIFGILVFSGSLYLLSITGLRWLGAITPIGGLLFLIGWALLAL